MAEQLRILLAEDSETDAELVQRELKRGGLDFRIRRVQTEPDFRRELGELRPHIVISDFSMPQFSGRTALAITRESGADTPFIFISGTIGEDVAVDMMRAGADDYVMKNNLTRLLPALQRELREADRRRAHTLAEEERKKAEQSLAESESLKSAILESSLDGLITIDHRGNIVEFNPAAAAMFGIPREQALGKAMAEMFIPPRLRDAHHHGFARYLVTGEGPILGKRLELEGMRADGAEFPIELTITAIKSRSGTLFTAFIRDITERKESEAKIRRLNRVHVVLSGINALIVRVRNRDELFQGACRIAVDAGQLAMAWIGLVDRETRRVKPVAWGGGAEKFLASAPLSLSANRAEGRGMSGSAISEKAAVIANDIQNDSRTQM